MFNQKMFVDIGSLVRWIALNLKRKSHEIFVKKIYPEVCWRRAWRRLSRRAPRCWGGVACTSPVWLERTSAPTKEKAGIVNPSPRNLLSPLGRRPSCQNDKWERCRHWSSPPPPLPVCSPIFCNKKLYHIPNLTAASFTCKPVPHPMLTLLTKFLEFLLLKIPCEIENFCYGLSNYWKKICTIYFINHKSCQKINYVNDALLILFFMSS